MARHGSGSLGVDFSDLTVRLFSNGRAMIERIKMTMAKVALLAALAWRMVVGVFTGR
jgi:hypothetical protein